MHRLRATSEQQAPIIWEQFQRVIDPQVLRAPRIDWDQIDRRLMSYINRFVAETPWVNHLALLVAVSTCHARLDFRTVKGRLQILHLRWKSIFSSYGLTDFTEWEPGEHLARYMHDPEFADSFETRQTFLRLYTAATRSLQLYFRSLPKEDQAIYQQWNLPVLPMGMRGQLLRNKELQERRTQRRKAESDVVTPHFARIRGEAHRRWNEISRLWQTFQQMLSLVQAGKAQLPVVFSYEEPRRKQRLTFTLWDRPSFVLAHDTHYTKDTVSEARRRVASFMPEHNCYFLEFVGADTLADTHAPRDPDALLWFGDLLRYGVLGRYQSGPQEEIQRKLAYLRSWGYGRDEATGKRDPNVFNAQHPGLLIAEKADGGQFIKDAQKRTDGLVFLVEPLFAAATFGLAALDFFTTTGARVSELLQITLQPECLYTMQIGGIQRLLVRLIPKGRERPEDYMVGLETRRNLERVANLLTHHYHLQPGDVLPSVPFHPDNERAHQFPGKRPYLFQYRGQHLKQGSITACMRFLCHGMVFITAENKNVVLKAHLLRHVFATHIHNVEQVPLDIVAKILHQKDVRVTGYYGAPMWQQVVDTTDMLLDRFVTHLGDVEAAFARAPAELQQQWEDAKAQVGALARVPGGDCSCYALCPFSFVCTGCIYKIPDPSRRDEIVEQRQWAMIRLDQVKKRGMGPETAKMQTLIQHCDTELEEMTMIERYRKDEAYEPIVRIKSRGEEQAPLVKAVSSSSATKNGRTGQNDRRSVAQRRTNSNA